MRINSVRDLEGLRPVLMEENSTGPVAVYWVFSEVSDQWENLTIITPGKYSQEFPKTYGHYHNSKEPEIYHLVQGEGLLLLQKQHDDRGVFIPEQIDEVIILTVKPGEEVKITQEYGHSWTNLGNTPLISYDNWKSGHTPADYTPIERLHGMAYYIIEENKKPKAIPNPNYQNLPEPQWLSVQEFNKKGR